MSSTTKSIVYTAAIAVLAMWAVYRVPQVRKVVVGA